jgi:hypothetical protein
MLSGDQAELTPDLAKSALHFEYEFVELTCFVCTMVTPACQLHLLARIVHIRIPSSI